MLLRRLSLLVCGLLACTAALNANAPKTIPEKETQAVGPYVLNNNVWGKDKSPNGWQLVDLLETGKTVTWRVRYNWPVGSDQYGVKCYPSIINGWQWGSWSSDKHLPVTLSDLRSVHTGASVEVVNPGVQNIAYDLWFHAAGPVDKQPKPSDELMVWMDRFQGAGPLGTKQAVVTIGGATWELYVGDIGWKVFSFVRTENTPSWELDLKAFIDVLIERKLMPASKQLTGVQFGTEVFQSPGDGAVTVKNYFAEVK